MIIGFPKCGTTSLYEYLIKHPSIFPASGKEIDYFDRLYQRGEKWYRTSFPSIFTKFFHQKILRHTFLTGEATPRYVEHPHALNRIKKFFPNTKFIVLLRNPIDRAFSHYHRNTKNEYEYRSFEDALHCEKERIKGRYEKMQKDTNYYSWDYDLYAYLTHGIYFDKLERWMKIFPRKQFLIIQSEEFLKNPSKIFNQTLQFLKLQSWELKEYHIHKKQDYKDDKTDPTLRNKLQEFFKPHNEKLYDLIGQKFDWNN